MNSNSKPESDSGKENPYQVYILVCTTGILLMIGSQLLAISLSTHQSDNLELQEHWLYATLVLGMCAAIFLVFSLVALLNYNLYNTVHELPEDLPLSKFFSWYTGAAALVEIVLLLRTTLALMQLKTPVD